MRLLTASLSWRQSGAHWARLEVRFAWLLARYIIGKTPSPACLLSLRVKSLHEATGQVTMTFENSPQGPLKDSQLDPLGDPRVSLTSRPLSGSGRAASPRAACRDETRLRRGGHLPAPAPSQVGTPIRPLASPRQGDDSGGQRERFAACAEA